MAPRDRNQPQPTPRENYREYCADSRVMPLGISCGEIESLALGC